MIGIEELLSTIPAVTAVHGAGRGTMYLYAGEVEWALERVLAKSEDRGGCWWWTGYRRNGYGSISIRDSEVYIHALVCSAVHGPAPRESEVLHKCDAKPCWNPGHLRHGTHLENVQDAIGKGRAVMPPRASGVLNPKARLSDVDIADIRRAWEEDRPEQRVLAAAYGVSQSTIWRYVHRRVRV